MCYKDPTSVALKMNRKLASLARARLVSVPCGFEIYPYFTLTRSGVNWLASHPIPDPIEHTRELS
jgi:hypothetical protein